MQVSDISITSEDDFNTYLTHQDYALTVDVYPFNESYDTTSIYVSNGDGTYTEVIVTDVDVAGNVDLGTAVYDQMQAGNEVFLKVEQKAATKIEVDVADLEAKITANADAIAAVKATVDDGLYVQVEADAAYVAGTTYYKADAEAGYVVDESVVDDATFDTAKANGLYVLADDAIAALSAKIAQNAADIADNNDAIDAVSYVQCTTNTVFDANTTYFMVDTDGNFVEDTAIVDADTFATAVAAGTAFVKTTDVVKANESRIATIENALTWGTFA